METEIYIHEIDTTKLPTDACVLNMESLIETLGISHPWRTHEFLFVQRIPAQALVSQRSLGEILEQGTWAFY